MIDSFINAIYLYDDKITFIFNYKDGTQTVSLAEFEATCGSDIKLLGAPAKTPEKFGCFLSVFYKRVGGSRKPDGAAHTTPDTHTLKLSPDCRRVFVVRKTLLKESKKNSRKGVFLF